MKTIATDRDIRLDDLERGRNICWFLLKKMLDEEFWKRIGPTMRECKAAGRGGHESFADTAARSYRARQGKATEGFPRRGGSGRGGDGGDVGWATGHTQM